MKGQAFCKTGREDYGSDSIRDKVGSRHFEFAERTYETCIFFYQIIFPVEKYNCYSDMKVAENFRVKKKKNLSIGNLLGSGGGHCLFILTLDTLLVHTSLSFHNPINNSSSL